MKRMNEDEIFSLKKFTILIKINFYGYQKVKQQKFLLVDRFERFFKIHFDLIFHFTLIVPQGFQGRRRFSTMDECWMNKKIYNSEKTFDVITIPSWKIEHIQLSQKSIFKIEPNFDSHHFHSWCPHKTIWYHSVDRRPHRNSSFFFLKYSNLQLQPKNI